MPPPGGYSSIQYLRVPAQRIIGYKALFYFSLVLTVYSFNYFSKRRTFFEAQTLDFGDHMIAVEPLVLAEKDRAFLRQLRHNRNIERNLMQKVRDWKVGTLWGKPIFNNLPNNTIPDISLEEFNAHREACEMKHHDFVNKDIFIWTNNVFTML